MKRTAILSITAALFAAPALAGDLGEATLEQAPTAVAAAPIAYGADWGGAYFGATVGYGDANGTGYAADVNGATYGAFAGYNYDIGTVVLGGELEFGGASITDANTGDSFESMTRLKAKVGYDAGRFLPYVTAGANYLTKTDSTSDWGYVAGAGVDYALSDSIVLGGEVLYNRWNDFNNTGNMINATTAAARVSFKF